MARRAASMRADETGEHEESRRDRAIVIDVGPRLKSWRRS
jgi:hypothetical protein